MKYKEKIAKLIDTLADKEIISALSETKSPHKPQEASSDFLTNKQWGDYGERVALLSINFFLMDYGFIAVKYGESSNIVAGEEGFDEFWEGFQKQYKIDGKHPDILIFPLAEYNFKKFGNDISKLSMKDYKKIVPKAVAAFEVRMSRYSFNKNAEFWKGKIKGCWDKVSPMVKNILSEFGKTYKKDKRYGDILATLKSMTADNYLSKAFNLPLGSILPKDTYIHTAIKDLKAVLKKVQGKKVGLSFTPKEEDIKGVNKWVQYWNIPHYYIQAFTDEIFIISFEQVLKLLTEADKNDGKEIFFGGDVKNHGKKVVKTRLDNGVYIGGIVREATPISSTLVTERGKRIDYTKYAGGLAFLKAETFMNYVGLPISKSKASKNHPDGKTLWKVREPSAIDVMP